MYPRARSNSGRIIDDGIRRDATISADLVYRYRLIRWWAGEGRTIAFIGLNPSTADEQWDDQTVRKCIRLTKKFGGTKLLMGNLFAYRSRDPSLLSSADDPVGPDNDQWLDEITGASELVIAAWGTRGTLLDRAELIRKRYAGKLQALRLTCGGQPCHPLYLPERLSPFEF